MTLSRPANGNATHELAHAVALQAVINLSARKNVSLDLTRTHEIAQGALEWMSSDQLAAICALRTGGLQALGDKINRILDMLVMARISGHVSAIENTETVHDPAVAAILQEIVSGIRKASLNPSCIVWPDSVELVDGYYAARTRNGGAS